MAWVEEGVMPSVQLIRPPAVGHNIVPGKQANKGNTVAAAEPVEFVAKDVTKRNTLENAAGATQDSVPGHCVDLPGVYMGSEGDRQKISPISCALSIYPGIENENFQ
ncbi:MAG: hypothetical protein NT166_11670 [Candidatus Aminicenantes bacterium]|nr:hypothetical protein [Candidatus Aminicenantes bacterium]